jgi:hypothetical protein
VLLEKLGNCLDLWFESEMSPKARVLKDWLPADGLWGSDCIMRVLTSSVD